MQSPSPRSGEDHAIGARIEDCSCPRGGGWRPGARWSQADIDALPPHQRPPMRELGRRTEAAKAAFHPSPASGRGKAGAPRPQGEGESVRAGRAQAGEGILLTAHKVGPRVEIAAACPAARALGLAPGMPLAQARAMVPGLDIRDADPEGDRALLTRLCLFAARRWTPRASLSGGDGLFLDLDGVSHLFGGEARMCARIRAFCARLGLAARIAVAATPGAAHALARHGADDLILCPAGDEAQAIAPLPVSALRVGDDALTTARRLGIDTVGDLLGIPRAPLNRRFGKELLARLDQALGRKGEPLAPIVPEELPRATLPLLEPIATAEAIGQVLADLMPILVGMLEEAGLAVRRLGLSCDRVDGTTQRLAIGTARATRDGVHLLRLLCMKIEKIEPGFGIEAMHLDALRCEPLGPQAIGGDLCSAPYPSLAELIDTLVGRIGVRRVYRRGAVESDVPERSVRRLPPLEKGMDWPSWPRPARLFARPERVENVMALLPDGAPRRFIWRGRPHVVARADGPERIFGEWWRRTAEADAVRDYFQVEDATGARFWLYRSGDGEDARTGDLSWWMQGAYG